ncbi:MAG: PAS domain-containing protein, partial [Parvibaculum sp.]|nr:PAS domain-containing protein [Parvibaculum sp.]
MAQQIFDGLAAVAWEVRPYRRLARLDWFTRPWLAMEALEMPLLDDEGRVSTILRGASHFTVGADWGVAGRMSWPVAV